MSATTGQSKAGVHLMAITRPDNARWLSLFILCAGFLMIVVDSTIVNVALPSIQRDLGFSQSSLAWVVNAYLIAYAGIMLLAGRLGDLVGRKRIFLIGLVMFTAASVLCGLSFSQPLLIAARFVQGVGGAVSSAVILGMVVTMFPEPGERARAISIFSFVASAGASVGLLAGGLITQAMSWHWIFFVNLPIGLATALVGARLLENDPGIGLGEGADVIGAILVTAALMLGVYTIVDSANYGLGSARTLGTGAVAVTLLTAFFVRQHLARTPLLPLRILRSRNVAGANLVQALTVAAAFGFQVLIPQYMQRVLGYGAAGAGTGMLPAAVVIGILSAGLSARLIARFGLPTMLLTGGFGLAFPAMIPLAMSGAPDTDAGVASGLVNTTQQVGAALGVAVLSTLAASRTGHLLAAGQPAASALTGGYHLAFGTGAGLAAAALVLAAVVRPARTGPPAESSGEISTGHADTGQTDTGSLVPWP